MKRIGVLLAVLLVLTGLPFYAATAESSFTGVVTYRSGKEAYLQSGSRGLLAFLDSTNDPDQMAAVRVGTVITVSGESMTLNQAGYHIPELIDAMIVDISGTQNLPSPISATMDQLGDGLMAVRVQVRATKAAFEVANIQLSLGAYGDDQLLIVTGVLSANIRGRIIWARPSSPWPHPRRPPHLPPHLRPHLHQHPRQPLHRRLPLRQRRCQSLHRRQPLHRRLPLRQHPRQHLRQHPRRRQPLHRRLRLPLRQPLHRRLPLRQHPRQPPRLRLPLHRRLRLPLRQPPRLRQHPRQSPPPVPRRRLRRHLPLCRRPVPPYLPPLPHRPPQGRPLRRR